MAIVIGGEVNQPLFTTEETQIKDEMYDLPLEASLWCDLLGTALARVDWREVIENN